MVNQRRVAVGTIVYNSGKYLPYFLKSVVNQDYGNFEIVIQDNTNGASKDLSWIHKNYPKIKTIKSENIGFGASHNNMIKNSEGEYYLALNPDMIFEKNFISELVKALNANPQAASATGKLRHWNFANADLPDRGRTDLIDTTGLLFLQNHRFEDRGQGQIDEGQFDQPEEIFGASGAAVIYRRRSLNEVTYQEEYFDELMFMYKEDIDLAYRLQWAGFKCLYTPTANAYHDRTAEKEGKKSNLTSILIGRKGKSKTIKKWSYLNHQILLRKNFDSRFSFKTKFKTRLFQILSHLYLLLHEPFLLAQRRKLRQLLPEIKKRKAQLQKRVHPNEIEKWMR